MHSENDFGVIFDMDGVLIDSTKHIWDSFNELLAPKVFFEKTHIKKYLGNSLRDQAARWKEDHGVDVGDLKEFSRKANEIALKGMGGKPAPKEGVLTLLTELKKLKIPLGVGTSSGRERTLKLLTLMEILPYFDGIATSTEVQEHKPNPHVFLEAARQMEMDPRACVVIEDADSGILAAKRGGMKAIGVVTEWNSAEELAEADLIIKSLEELSVQKMRTLFSFSK